MPSAEPRSNATKKEEQLRQKRQELEHAIRCELPQDKLARAAERVRAAQLSLLKARLHWIEDAQIQRSTLGSSYTRDVGEAAGIIEATRSWTEKAVETIIGEHAKT